MFFSCSVCTEVLASSCEMTSTYCGHVFHTKCIVPWIERQQNCPQCRTRCTNQTVHQIYLSGSPKENVIPDLLQMAAENGHLGAITFYVDRISDFFLPSLPPVDMRRHLRIPSFCLRSFLTIYPAPSPSTICI